MARPVALGVITTPPSSPVPARLAELLDEVRLLFDECRPQVLAIERVLFQTNVQTAMSVGQASGVIMAEAAQRGIAVVEYSPNQVKEAVAGHGVREFEVGDVLGLAVDDLQDQRTVRVFEGFGLGDASVVDQGLHPGVVAGDAAERARSQGATEDALRYLQAANDAVPASHTSIRAELLVELGLVCVASGHRSDAARHWNQALLLYRQLGDPHGTTRVNRELAQLAWGDGDRARG